MAATVNRRPGPRRTRGNAFYVESARAALGVRPEVHSLSDVPLPLVHTALGVAVCAVLAALRPQSVGLRTAVLAAGALALTTAVTLTLYDHLVYGRPFHHAMAAMALPLAAISGFVVVLGGTADLALRIVAAVICVAVIGGVPHLGGLRAAGREGAVARLTRDVVGIAVLAPLLLASFGGGLAWWSSATLAGGAVLLVTFDALLTEGLGVRAALVAAVLVAALLAALVVLLPPAGRGTLRAASALVLWYGLCGLVRSILSPGKRRAAAVLEYLPFVGAAAAAIAWGALHR